MLKEGSTEKIEFSQIEAALYISLRVALGDGVFVPEEAKEVLKYYDYSMVKVIEDKLGGLDDLSNADEFAAKALADASRDFKLRAVAIGLAVSHSDGYVHVKETEIINGYAEMLGLNSLEVVQYCHDKLLS